MYNLQYQATVQNLQDGISGPPTCTVDRRMRVETTGPGTAGVPSGGVQSTQEVGTLLTITQNSLDANGIQKVVQYDGSGNVIDQAAAVPTYSAAPSAPWSYASGSGGETVTSTTAVAMAAAAGVNIRNYISRISFATATLGAAGEIQVLDGTTVIWRGYLNTAAIQFQETFTPPLRTTANAALNFKIPVSLTSGKLYVNAAGYSA